MTGSVLAILSHVVHGYVGNRAMVFPLQYAGWNVDALNTTNLLNHPGYGSFAGEQTPPDTLRQVLEGLELIGNSLDTYDVVITGYAPTAAILTAVKLYILNLAAEKRPLYVMDPILGDNGKLYVNEDVIPIYKDLLASGRVGLITPNQFEFELFSGVSVSDASSLKQAIAAFNERYQVPNIVISSVTLDSRMYAVGHTRKDNQTFLVPISEIECKFFGCGDLLTALLTHSFFRAGRLTPEALVDSVLKLTKILEVSLAMEREKTPEKDITVVRDIQVVASRDVYLEDLSSAHVDVTYI